MAGKKKIDISMGVEALLENGFFYLEKKKWKQSKEYFDKVIEVNPRNSQAHIGLLLAAYKLPTTDELVNSPKPFNNNENYKSALQYGNEEIKSQLKGYEDLYNKKIEEQYQTACDKLSKSQTLKQYKECYDAFHKLGEYKDSKAMAEKAKESIGILEYEDCVAKMNDKLSEKEWLQLSEVLSKIKYKDSQALAKKCRANYESLKASREEEERKEKIYSSACSKYNPSASIKDILDVKATFESIANFKDSKAWILKCQNLLDNKKGSFLLYKALTNNTCMLIVTAILFVIFCFILPGEMLMCFIVGEIIGAIIAVSVNGGFTGNYGLVLFISFWISGVLALLLGLVMGIDLYPSEHCDACGGRGYFGGGAYGQMVDCPSCSN